jgi:plastocyanin domain-containing protein
MSVDEAAVLAAGVASIVWVNWYFLFSQRRRAGVAASHDGAQEIEILVKGGYTPSLVKVAPGPVRLVFDRQEENSCSEEIVLPDFGVRRFLPPFQKTIVEITAAVPGTYDFMCGMSMLHGRMIVAEKEAE